MNDKEIDEETERLFCFFELGFHEEKYLCQTCKFFPRCVNDARKMRLFEGRLPWVMTDEEFDKRYGLNEKGEDIIEEERLRNPRFKCNCD